MEFIRGDQALSIAKPDGTRVRYYVMPEYEIHHNTIPPGSAQVWHRHETIDEVVLVLDGALTAIWLDDEGAQHTCVVRADDMVLVQRSFHTFENRSSAPCSFIVAKLVLGGDDHRTTFKCDKLLEP